LAHNKGVLEGNWEVLGNFVIGSEAGAGDASIYFTGNQNQTYTYSGGTYGTARMLVNKTGGAFEPAPGTTGLEATRLSLVSGYFLFPSGTTRLGKIDVDVNADNPLTITNGTFDHGNGTIVFQTGATGNLAYQNSDSTITAPANSVFYNLKIDSAGANATPNTFSFTNSVVVENTFTYDKVC